MSASFCLCQSRPRNAGIITVLSVILHLQEMGCLSPNQPVMDIYMYLIYLFIYLFTYLFIKYPLASSFIAVHC